MKTFLFPIIDTRVVIEADNVEEAHEKLREIRLGYDDLDFDGALERKEDGTVVEAEY